MSTINTAKIGTVATVAPGATSEFTWNNPPWGKVVSYLAYPVPHKPSAGPHGSSIGMVEVTKVVFVSVIDHYNGDRQEAVIDVTNRGSEPTGYDLYETWIS